MNTLVDSNSQTRINHFVHLPHTQSHYTVINCWVKIVLDDNGHRTVYVQKILASLTINILTQTIHHQIAIRKTAARVKSTEETWKWVFLNRYDKEIWRNEEEFEREVLYYIYLVSYNRPTKVLLHLLWVEWETHVEAVKFKTITG